MRFLLIVTSVLSTLLLSACVSTQPAEPVKPAHATDAEINQFIAEVCVYSGDECVCMVNELGQRFPIELLHRIDRGPLSEQEKKELNELIPYLEETCDTSLSRKD